MHIRWVGQLLVAFALLLIVWNILISEFGRSSVLRSLDWLNPIDVMFLIAVGLVGLLALGGRSPPGGGNPRQTRTIW